MVWNWCVNDFVMIDWVCVDIVIVWSWYDMFVFVIDFVKGDVDIFNVKKMDILIKFLLKLGEKVNKFFLYCW